MGGLLNLDLKKIQLYLIIKYLNWHCINLDWSQVHWVLMETRTQNCMEELRQMFSPKRLGKFWENVFFVTEVATLWGDKKYLIFKEWDPKSLQIRAGILGFSTSPWDY